MPTLEGIKTWAFDQVETAFVIIFVFSLLFAAWKRSIGLGITFIVVGIILGIFVFNPEAIRGLAERAGSLLGI
ncbi:hypothetical protein [Mammaliicoccus sciuri]|uniref:hypothetical protein n=1 Tax=Mammaliicoccus sciuri TaxID=1296 RepID=UPI002737BDD5|nr:hypothetical protein [Mammaliicoccus sciuri]